MKNVLKCPWGHLFCHLCWLSSLAAVALRPSYIQLQDPLMPSTKVIVCPAAYEKCCESWAEWE